MEREMTPVKEKSKRERRTHAQLVLDNLCEMSPDALADLAAEFGARAPRSARIFLEELRMVKLGDPS